MNHLNKRLKSHSYAHWATFQLFLMLLALQTKAQPVIPKWPHFGSTLTQNTVSTTSNPPDWINCDMYHLTSAGGSDYLYVVVYDDPVNNNVYVKIYDTYNNTSYSPTAISDARHPDVVIGDNNLSSSTLGRDYIVAVVYENTNDNKVYIQPYDVTGVFGASVSMATKWTAAAMHSGGSTPQTNPHIDLAAHATVTFGGLPILQKYIATWAEDNSGTMEVWAQYGNVDAGSFVAAQFYVDNGEMPDVGYIYDNSLSDYSAYFLYVDAINSTLRTATVTEVTTPVNRAVSSSVVEGPITVTAPPRIDANYANFANHLWYAVAEVSGSPSQVHDYLGDVNGVINARNVASITTYSAPGITTANPLTSRNGWSPAVALPNNDMGIINWTTTQQSIGFYMDNAASSPTGSYIEGMAFSHYGTNPQFGFQEIDSPPVTLSSGKNVLALGMATNDGEAMMAAWYNYDHSTDQIDYSYTTNTTTTWAFKPTTVAETSGQSMWKVFPNPTSGVANIAGKPGATYTVTDISGRILLHGTMARVAERINIASLPAGMYLLQLKSGSDVETLKLFKQ